MLENLSVTICTIPANTMQSGYKKSTKWQIKFLADSSKFIHNFTGWTGSSDTRQQLNLTFANKEQAMNFAKNNNWKYEVITPKEKKIIPKSYADNFAY